MWTGLSLLRTGFIISFLWKKGTLQEIGNFFINSSPIIFFSKDSINSAIYHIRNKITFQKLYTWRQTCKTQNVSKVHQQLVIRLTGLHSRNLENTITRRLYSNFVYMKTHKPHDSWWYGHYTEYFIRLVDSWYGNEIYLSSTKSRAAPLHAPHVHLRHGYSRFFPRRNAAGTWSL